MANHFWTIAGYYFKKNIYAQRSQGGALTQYQRKSLRS